MTTFFRDLADWINAVQKHIRDFKYLMSVITGKDFIAQKAFVVRVTDQGSFFLNNTIIDWISTDSNTGRLLRTLVNERYYASDLSLKNALVTSDISLVYKEINRLKVLFKKNGYDFGITKLKDGYEITHINRSYNNN